MHLYTHVCETMCRRTKVAAHTCTYIHVGVDQVCNQPKLYILTTFCVDSCGSATCMYEVGYKHTSWESIVLITGNNKCCVVHVTKQGVVSAQMRYS